MSLPVEQQQQQPPQLGLSQQVYTTHSHHGSIGSVIAVLTVITVLGFVAGMIGRLCSGRRVRGLGQYDFESWVERKCSSCIDGRIGPPPPAPLSNISSSPDSVPVVIPIEIPEETKETEQSHQNPPPASNS
ncbi:hypothetical protein BVC80_8611g9 [Macleaya cordata]|uniref:Transmembrane protein n=1 Tax=Macleaya cordata TaxID=56857 RepID=A0A200QK34_MACCD|nr:hypothetical protein BVC80_8611g9 [Macleaya cordata]